MSVVMKRRSVRVFEETPVSNELVVKLLEAGMQAPSAHNQQPWEFIVVDDRTLLDEMSKMSNGSKLLMKAPLAIITMMKESDKSPYMRPQDMSAATENILVRAVELGLGGVWIGVYPLEERMKHVSDIFHINGTTVPFSIIAIGYPKEDKEVIKRFDPARVRYNEWVE
jgi:nitroreductase